MTDVPLPDISAIRARMIYTDVSANFIGTRLFFSYTGGPPTSADLNSLAAAIEAAHATHLAPLISTDISLTEIDLLDLATDAGNSGVWTGTSAGTRVGTSMPAQIPFNLQYAIARRYRGGKPKGYWPFGVPGDGLDKTKWTAVFVDAVEAAFAAWIAEVTGLSETSIALALHIGLSYYKHFANLINSSGRERAVPSYRAVATHDPITAYIGHQLYSSQRRRRADTTP